jgi:hypothetical protein
LDPGDLLLGVVADDTHHGVESIGIGRDLETSVEGPFDYVAGHDSSLRPEAPALARKVRPGDRDHIGVYPY